MSSGIVNNFFCLFFISLLTMSSSCDEQNTYQYYAKNACSFNIIIDYQISSTNDIVTLEPGGTYLLFQESRLGEPVDFVGEEMYPFSHIDVMTTDSVQAKNDFYKREFWDFTSSDSSASYTLEVKDTDF